MINLHFAPGDIVQFRSGGLRMTVRAVFGDTVSCEWLGNSQQYHISYFPYIALVKDSDGPVNQKTEKKEPTRLWAEYFL
ncbi:DUF2158 domain-containing protein [Rudanella paleaurantiibacter]|uniref:DUF2158 domain-containing protein n=1 Tax=Rudanella paleaurantiibacter TaxID=2614655 RepID=A0A7J5TV67_9BACT|nr:DUF2158 domain-containing protein [Rudanella paleaurantiibacter]